MRKQDEEANEELPPLDEPLQEETELPHRDGYVKAKQLPLIANEEEDEALHRVEEFPPLDEDDDEVQVEDDALHYEEHHANQIDDEELARIMQLEEYDN